LCFGISSKIRNCYNRGARTLLKKWFIFLLVLLCTIFTVSSGCSEKSRENIDQDSVENNKEDIAKNSEEETSVEVKPAENSANWCPVGTSMKQTDPMTGEVFTIKVTGIETVDGIPMCKAVGENIKEDDYSKIDYFWSQDGNTSFWGVYDKSGNRISEVSVKEGKMKIVDKDGKITEFTTDS
jgi:hypothetical protein